MENSMIHVRFNNDATVCEISERPDTLSAQAWFDHLSRNTQDCYTPYSGGRGMFRLTAAQLAELKQGH